MNALEQQIADILHTRFGVPRDEIEAEATFEELSVDSLIIVELALILRKELGVELEDWDLRPDMTISAAAEFLTTNKAVAL